MVALRSCEGLGDTRETVTSSDGLRVLVWSCLALPRKAFCRFRAGASLKRGGAGKTESWRERVLVDWLESESDSESCLFLILEGRK